MENKKNQSIANKHPNKSPVLINALQEANFKELEKTLKEDFDLKVGQHRLIKKLKVGERQLSLVFYKIGIGDRLFVYAAITKDTLRYEPLGKHSIKSLLDIAEDIKKEIIRPTLKRF